VEGKKGEERKQVQDLGGSCRNIVLIMLNRGIPDKVKWVNHIENGFKMGDSWQECLCT